MHTGNKIELFMEGGEAFAAIYEAMNNAREEILLETYMNINRPFCTRSQ